MKGLRRKINICDCSRSYQIPQTDQITEISPYARNYFLKLDMVVAV